MLAACLILLMFSVASCSKSAVESEDNFSLSSPSGNLALAFNLAEGGVPMFSVLSSADTVITNVPLGLKTMNADLGAGFTSVSVSPVQEVTDEYEMKQGKAREISYNANERSIVLSKAETELKVTFRLSDDGVGFKYVTSNNDNEIIRVREENTAYTFPNNAKMWAQPMSVPKSGWRRTNPSYEEPYLQAVGLNTNAPLEYGYVYPLLVQTNDHWVLISETGMNANYAASRLVSKEASLQVEFPPEVESIMDGDHLPNASGRLESPWRLLSIGDLATVTESTLGTDLARPSEVTGDDFVKPGYASWSWVILKDNSVVYPVQKEFIDYAADMGWEYCLVDVNWDRNIGYEKIEELAQYALSKGVGLLLWYNSSGDWNDTDYSPKSKLLTKETRRAEFERIHNMGVKGVKIDFFGGDGQSVMAYYEDILKDAADFELLVNFHGATLPRGWQRTFPNLMTVEAIKGFEFITFEQAVADKAPEHCATLPFTRNVFDPMDFTPMALNGIPGIEMRTTKGFELALPTLFQSGIQHLAETPDGMNQQPAYVKEYLRNLPVQWDEMKLLTGHPGKEVVIARRAGNAWFIAGINGEDKRKSLAWDFDFVTAAEGYIIKDYDGEERVTKEPLAIRANDTFSVNVPANGGFVIKLIVQE